MLKKWQKSPYFGEKIAKNGGFLRVFGQNMGFLVLAPFPAPQNCGILWGPIGDGN